MDKQQQQTMSPQRALQVLYTLADAAHTDGRDHRAKEQAASVIQQMIEEKETHGDYDAADSASAGADGGNPVAVPDGQ